MKPSKNLTIILAGLIFVFGLFLHLRKINIEKADIYLPYLKARVLEFANTYKDKSVIVVSKKDHLLYFVRNGEIVKNDYWEGFAYSFPVEVSLAGRFYKTPEGIMYIESKNPYSRYIKFLKLSYPGAYGIHSGPTHLASFLERNEKKDPNFKFVTLKDDTRGCVAVENRVIKYLFAKVEVNTPVLIMP